jgi:hypothetical protein
MTKQELFSDFYTEEQMAELLGISVLTLRNRHYSRKNHPPRVEGTRLYLKSEFLKWARDRQEHETKEAS